ncbi:hypothetical protein GCM10009734_40250 [Nonomuraea bangladeshensis]
MARPTPRETSGRIGAVASFIGILREFDVMISNTPGTARTLPARLSSPAGNAGDGRGVLGGVKSDRQP